MSVESTGAAGSGRRSWFRHEKLADCVGIVAAGVVVALWLCPLQNAPFIDDFTYAWSVEQLMQGHPLRILEWSANVNMTQVLWGWLFCLPGGFSFTALRMSTLVLAWGGLCAFYLLLRELRVARREALLGTALLGVNPIFFMLGFTFMTDMSFVALMLWACYATVRALQQQSDGWLVAAVGLACLAAGTRATAAGIAVAMMLGLWFHSGGWGRRKWRFLWPGLSLVVLAGWIGWRRGHLLCNVDFSEVGGTPEDRVRSLQYALPLLPRMLLLNAAFVSGAVGLAGLPLALASVRRRELGRMLVVLAALGAVLWLACGVGARPPAPLCSGSTWSLVELGGTEGLTPGYLKPAWPAWWGMMVWVVSLGSAAVLLACWSRRVGGPGESLLRWMLAVQFVLMAVLWLFYDRYALPLLPLAIALTLAARPTLRWARAAPALAALAAISFVGVRDHLAYNRALWQAVDELHRRGAADEDIDGGYVVNGWLQYAHPEHAARDGQGRMAVPWLNTSDSGLRYQISNSPVPGKRLIETIPYRRWFSRSGSIYLYER